MNKTAKALEYVDAGDTVTEAARKADVSRQAVHAALQRREAGLKRPGRRPRGEVAAEVVVQIKCTLAELEQLDAWSEEAGGLDRSAYTRRAWKTQRTVDLAQAAQPPTRGRRRP